MPKTVETYRTTKALRTLVRRAAKLESKRPSEFLRQAAEEKALAVLAAAAREEPEDAGRLAAREGGERGRGRTARSGGSPRVQGRPEVRVVLDSSVLVAALATPNPASASRVVLAAASAGAVRLVITDDLEVEYRRAVEYPRVARCAPRVDRQAFGLQDQGDVAERCEPGAAAASSPPTPPTTRSWRRRSVELPTTCSASIGTSSTCESAAGWRC